MGISDSFSLSNLFVAVAGLFFAVGVALMSSPHLEQRHAAKTGFTIGAILLYLSLMGFVTTVLQMSQSKRYIIAVLGGVFISVFWVWIMSVSGMVPQETAIAQTPSATTPSQNCTGNCSFNQSGGTVIQNINQDPIRLKFDASAADALVSQMQPKKPVTFVGIGNTNADNSVIQEYANFFLRAGYQVKLITIGIAIPAPSKKISLNSLPDAYELMIAPSAF